MKIVRFLSVFLWCLVSVWLLKVAEHSPLQKEGQSPTPDSGRPSTVSRPTLRESMQGLWDSENSLMGAAEADTAKTLAMLPDGPFKESLLRLAPLLRLKALRVLASCQPPKEDYNSLRASLDGSLYYACEGHPVANYRPQGIPAAKNSRAARSQGLQSGNPLTLHSRPGAANTLYLDFTGGVISGTQWNVDASVSSFKAVPLDFDGQPNDFSAEAYLIQDVWRSVAEDFAPFDIDITTERPAVFSNRTGHAMITRKVDANGVNMPSAESGGVAFLSVFNSPDYAKHRPCLIYYENTGGYFSDIAMVVSHEFGHNLSLSHDGQTVSTEYYLGHGNGGASWGPIMGAPYSCAVVQWSKGDYLGSNNPQDDLKIIGDALAYRTDYGHHTAEAASPIADGSNAFQAGEVIRKADEPIYYKMAAAAGPVQLSVANGQGPSEVISPNLDIRLDVYDADGHLVKTQNPAVDTTASMSFEAKDGDYLIKISADSWGDPFASLPSGFTTYGSLGYFFISGTRVGEKPVITSVTSTTLLTKDLFSYQVSATNHPSLVSVTALPAGLSFDPGSGLVSGHVATPGSYSFHIKTANRWGTDEKDVSLLVSYDAPRFEGNSEAKHLVHLGEALHLAPSVQSEDPHVSYEWRHNGQPIDGALSPTLDVASMTLGLDGWYDLKATNSAGSRYSPPIWVALTAREPSLAIWSNEFTQPYVVKADSVVFHYFSDGGGISASLDGRVTRWDRVSTGTLLEPLQPDLVAVSAGYLQPEFLTSDGVVHSLGGGTSGAGINSPVVRIKGAAYSDFVYLHQNGRVSLPYGYDTGSMGALIKSLANVSDISMERDVMCIVYSNGDYVVRNGDRRDLELLMSGSSARSVESGTGGTYLLKQDGTVYRVTMDSLQPVATGIVSLQIGGGYALGIKADGTLNIFENSVPPELEPYLSGLVSLGGMSLLRDRWHDTLPAITKQPETQAVPALTDVHFEVVAEAGASPLSYQWRKNGVDLLGETSRALNIFHASTTDAGEYDVVVTSSKGSVASAAANLTVSAPPKVLERTPAMLRTAEGTAFTLFATVENPELCRFTWFRNGVPLETRTTSSLTIPSATRENTGAYFLRIDGPGGSSESLFFVCLAPEKTQVNVRDNSGYSTPPTVEQRSTWSHKAIRLVDSGFVDGDGVEYEIVYGTQQVVDTRSRPVYDVVYSTILFSDGTVDTQSYYSAAASLESKLKGIIAVTRDSALRGDGQLIVWDPSSMNRIETPAWGKRVTSISENDSGVFVLFEDGTVGSVMHSNAKFAAIPAGLVDVVGLFALTDSVVAVKRSGEAVVWGKELDPELFRNAVKVASPYVLRRDGTIIYFEAVGDSSGLNNSSPIVDIVRNTYLRDATRDTAPVLKNFPLTVSAAEGAAATLGGTVDVGTNDVDLRWSHDGADTYLKSNLVTLPSVAPRTAGIYTLKASNDLGSVEAQVELKVTAGPTLTATSAVNQIITKGAKARMSVTAVGTGTVSYQWYKDGVAISGATSSSYEVPSMAASNRGRYTVQANDANGRSLRMFNLLYAPLKAEYVMIGGTPAPPAKVGVLVAICESSYNILGLRADGTLVTWGSNVPFKELGSGYKYLENGFTFDADGRAYVADANVTQDLAKRYIGFSYGAGIQTNGEVDYPNGFRRFYLENSGLRFHVSGSTVRVTLQDGRLGDFSFQQPYDNIRDISDRFLLQRNGDFYRFEGDQPKLSARLATDISMASSTYLYDSQGSVILTVDTAGRLTTPLSGRSGITNVYALGPQLLVRESEGDAVPKIATQPSSVQVAEGQAIALSVEATSDSFSVTYQWRRNRVAIEGETSTVLRFLDVKHSDDADYDVVLKNSAGQVTSQRAHVSVIDVPVLTRLSPAVQVVAPSKSFSLDATASGLVGTAVYQWYLNGVLIQGESSHVLKRSAMKPLDAGLYRLNVTDSRGTGFVLFHVYYEPIEVQALNMFGTAVLPPGVETARAVGAGNGVFCVGLTTGKTWEMYYSNQDLIDRDFVAFAGDASGAMHAIGKNGKGYTRTSQTVWHDDGIENAVQIAAFAQAMFWLSSDGVLRGAGGDVYIEIPHVTMICQAYDGVYFTRVNGSAGHFMRGAIYALEAPDKLGWIVAGNGSPVLLTESGRLFANGSSIPVAEHVKRAEMIFNPVYLDSGGVTRNLQGEAVTGKLIFDRFVSGDAISSVWLVDKSSKYLPGGGNGLTSSYRQPGESVSLDFGVTGPDLTYQWYKDGQTLSGETSASLTLNNLTTAGAGWYNVVATNPYGSLSTRPVKVVVGAVSPSWLSNMSVRASAGEGGRPLIVGFVMSGGAKSVLVRCIGPTLGVFGVPGVMDDPLLELHRSDAGVDVIENTADNWADGELATTLSAAFSKVGAFALSDTTSKDAALLTAINGPRTVIVNTAKGGHPGVVLVEAYDAGSGVAQHLVNLSARNHAGVAGDTLIAGFVIDGNATKTLLVRGVGPTLGVFGVADVMSDPVIELHTNVPNGQGGYSDTVVATNDNWGDETGAAVAFQQAGAFALPTGSRDSAVVVSLPPGAYTAVLRSGNGQPGEALVEVYELP